MKRVKIKTARRKSKWKYIINIVAILILGMIIIAGISFSKESGEKKSFGENFLSQIGGLFSGTPGPLSPSGSSANPTPGMCFSCEQTYLGGCGIGLDNDCEGTIDCPCTSAGLVCSETEPGKIGRCEIPSCIPKTCSQLGKQCGTWSDGCENTLNCGNCPSGTCNDDGQCETAQVVSCASNSECDDNDPCTTDTCNNKTKLCEISESEVLECTSNSDCSSKCVDDTEFSNGRCEGACGKCVYSETPKICNPECSSTKKCSNPCQTCSNGKCVNVPENTKCARSGTSEQGCCSKYSYCGECSKKLECKDYKNERLNYEPCGVFAASTDKNSKEVIKCPCDYGSNCIDWGKANSDGKLVNGVLIDSINYILDAQIEVIDISKYTGPTFEGACYRCDGFVLTSTCDGNCKTGECGEDCETEGKTVKVYAKNDNSIDTTISLDKKTYGSDIGAEISGASNVIANITKKENKFIVSGKLINSQQLGEDKIAGVILVEFSYTKDGQTKTSTIFINVYPASEKKSVFGKIGDFLKGLFGR